ncbi:hypothetical protein A3Q56_02332 [Intoshia linei]|uniref:Uncharacterized protein n=1 Tax=Intoshia linei TaxID=1819745 RepID=A0A177B6Z0_9BILA|nr:hypothetical protein A3Q56_02332 [Intoshia linei]
MVKTGSGTASHRSDQEGDVSEINKFELPRKKQKFAKIWEYFTKLGHGKS